MNSRSTRSKPGLPVFEYYSKQTVLICEESSTCLDLLLPDIFRCQSCETFRSSPAFLSEDRDQPLSWHKYGEKRSEYKHKRYCCEQPHRADKYLAKEKKRVREGQAKRCLDVISFLEKYRSLPAQAHNSNLGPRSQAQARDPNSPAHEASNQNSRAQVRNLNPNPPAQATDPNLPAQASDPNCSLAQASDPNPPHHNQTIVDGKNKVLFLDAALSIAAARDLGYTASDPENAVQHIFSYRHLLQTIFQSTMSAIILDTFAMTLNCLFMDAANRINRMNSPYERVSTSP
jgi:hypothetical protein